MIRVAAKKQEKGRREERPVFCFLFFCFAVSLLNLACSPERDNPYDPNSDLYANKTTIQGTCQTRASVPIPMVKITLSPVNSGTGLQTLTNENGGYELLNCPAESVLVIAEKEGFVTESVKVLLLVYKTETLNFILEGLPKFLSAGVLSYYIVRHIPQDSAVLSIKCEIKDEDGQSDITSVFAIVDGLLDSLPLLFNTGYFYENSFLEESLSKSLDEILGRDIFIICQDLFGNEVKSKALRLTRIIRNPPEIISPQGGEIVSAHPLLVWNSPQYLFDHSFFCEIYHLLPNLPPVLYRRYENIPSPDSSFFVPDSLIPGWHYWQIGVRDRYANWAKSAEGVFQVQ